ncbi:death-associated protein-like 1-A [Astyanax mexicanus]|uniref:Death-associated protein-like 1-A n=2 Tax=Astyanax mexicanus TaxID=7994 RepID=A0A8T2LLE2_ASTMX|nr:death-associated protein-like 1-A [Astyanax mexicanus]KAG9271657.1 death-associated protein-like 1-A [Astyanax mexicanus]
MVQLSKAGMRDTLTLKAGHPPAVKAGGKRVVKKCSEESGTPDKEGKRAEKPRSLTVYSRMQQIGILMAGPLEKLGHDFPETPVSVRHSKVRPSAEKPHIQRNFFIQQPRKF